MKPIEYPLRDRLDDPPTSDLSPTQQRRRDLVRDLVAGAILPKLLARKDAGVFDSDSQVVRLNRLHSEE